MHKICKLLELGKYTYKEIAAKTGSTESIVANIKKGLAWTFISKDYKFKVKPTYELKRDDILGIMYHLQNKTKSMRQMARELGVSRATIENIKRHRTWDDVTEGAQLGEWRTIIDEATARKICEMLQNTNMTSREISAEIGCNHQVVDQIRGRRSWVKISKDYTFNTTNFKWNAYLPQIKEMYAKGLRATGMINELGLDPSLTNALTHLLNRLHKRGEI